MNEVDLGGEKSFIGAWVLPDLHVCDDIIRFFQQSGDKRPGVVAESVVNKENKDSLDVIVSRENLSHPTVERYLVTLMHVVQAYIDRYPTNRELGSWAITEPINIQYYRRGAGYKQWHTERTCGIEPFVKRHLVFMTYLNDVRDQGETEFFYQKIRVQPRKGLTLIWPADWTHVHRGVVSASEEKYIITGWFDFV
jgi:prolyl 4-hydroxylase